MSKVAKVLAILKQLKLLKIYKPFDLWSLVNINWLIVGVHFKFLGF